MKLFLKHTFTLCLCIFHTMYQLYLSYESFSHFFLPRALEDIRQKRPFIISRSTFPGQGHYGGHWSGDNSATFYDMYKSISGTEEISLFILTPHSHLVVERCVSATKAVWVQGKQPKMWENIYNRAALA